MRANPARALLPHLLITADVDDLGDSAVGRAELYRPRIWLREEGAAIGDDLLDKAATVVDLDAEMVDRRSVADELGFLVLLAVIDHQREIDIAVRQMPRNMAARSPGLHLP